MAELTVNTSPATSTSFLQMVQRYRVDFTIPALSSQSADLSTVTVTGLTTSSILLLMPRAQPNSSVVGVSIYPMCSTVNELVLTYVNGSVSSLSGSTQSAYLLQFSF